MTNTNNRKDNTSDGPWTAVDGYVCYRGVVRWFAGVDATEYADRMNAAGDAP